MVVVLNELDSKFKFQVAAEPGGEHIKLCFACGLCTAGCPVSSIDSRYNPRIIVRQIILGMKKEVLSSGTIWLCSQCYTCQAHCPQNVNFADVMKALREMATKEGYVHPSFIERIKEIDNFSQMLRHQIVNSIIDRKAEPVESDLRTLAEQALREMKT